MLRDAGAGDAARAAGIAWSAAAPGARCSRTAPALHARSTAATRCRGTRCCGPTRRRRPALRRPTRRRRAWLAGFDAATSAAMTTDALAQRAPRHAGRRRALGLDRRRRAAHRRRHAAWVGADADLPAGLAHDARARPRRRARHAGPGRLPHPPGLRRPARARVRAAPAGRELRGDRARRRRHPLDGGGDARGQRRRAVRARAARAPAALMAEGVTTLEIKSGYGLTPSTRARCLRVARAARPRAAARRCAPPAWPRTRCRPSSQAGADDYIDAVCDWLPALQARGPGRRGRRVLRAHRLHARADARVFEAARALRPAGQAARRAAQRPGRRRAGGALRRAVAATTSSTSATAGMRAMAAGRHAWPCCCPAPTTSCARPSCRRCRRCAPPACRSRSPPTTTPARRPRCRCC